MREGRVGFSVRGQIYRLFPVQWGSPISSNVPRLTNPRRRCVHLAKFTDIPMITSSPPLDPVQRSFEKDVFESSYPSRSLILICSKSKFNPPPFPSASMFHRCWKKKGRTAKRRGREGGRVDQRFHLPVQIQRNEEYINREYNHRAVGEREKRRGGGEERRGRSKRAEGRRREEKANLFPLTSFTVLRTTRLVAYVIRVEWRARANTVIGAPFAPRACYTRITVVGGKPSWPLGGERREPAGVRHDNPRSNP